MAPGRSALGLCVPHLRPPKARDTASSAVRLFRIGVFAKGMSIAISVGGAPVMVVAAPIRAAASGSEPVGRVDRAVPDARARKCA
jgi:hypothetical protein